MPSSHLILCRPFPPAPNPSQHQSLFQWVSSVDCNVILSCIWPRNYLANGIEHSLMCRCMNNCIWMVYTYVLYAGGTVVKNLPASAGDTRDVGSIPRSEWSPGVGNGNLLQYSCLEDSIERGTGRATVHGVTKSWTRLSDCTELNWFLECPLGMCILLLLGGV